ncbi:90 kDa surface protein, putative [Trypanosoma cruzi marinkellei]|uniref:90 kDa surface protein, putative n=1 Tax=Trypanosoma cruzi marinkellei TaxID=85056 RepID=K2MG81_TRYCR|nr:90 kDa surface protein, putative [Trypanosoma cruzi marinkellei]EKF26330.1 90 kDa surface protein, putative [Trypanosoma cruzi marinkellei]
MVMCRVLRVLLALALLCCCSCVSATEEGQDVVPVDAECAGKDKLGRWRLSGKSSWYNCTNLSSGAGKMICDMGVGTCVTENAEGRNKEGGAKGGVFTINVSTHPSSTLEMWWERNVEPKRADGGITPATPSAAGPSVPQEEAATRDTAPTLKSASPPAGDEGSAGASSPLETPDGAGVSSPAGTADRTDSSSPAAVRAPDPAPSGELPDATRSASSASSAPELLPDTKPTEGGNHSSHDSPVEQQEETSAAPATHLSQTGEGGSAAEGTEGDAAATTNDTASMEGNTTAASMPAPLPSPSTTKALENHVGDDACFHDTRVHIRLLLVLAALTYGTLG